MDYGWDEKRLANASWASYIATGNMLPRPVKNPNTCEDYNVYGGLSRLCETAPTLTSLSFETLPMSFIFKNCTKIMCNSMGFAKRKPYLTLAKSRAISLGLGFAFHKTHRIAHDFGAVFENKAHG